MSPLVFLAFFVRFMEKTPLITKFYGVFDHFPRTCEVVKFWTIKLYLYVIDVIHANEQTKYGNCSWRVNFRNFLVMSFSFMTKEDQKLSKSCYFGLRSPLSFYRKLGDYFFLDSVLNEISCQLFFPAQAEKIFWVTTQNAQNAEIVGLSNQLYLKKKLTNCRIVKSAMSQEKINKSTWFLSWRCRFK